MKRIYKNRSWEGKNRRKKAMAAIFVVVSLLINQLNWFLMFSVAQAAEVPSAEESVENKKDKEQTEINDTKEQQEVDDKKKETEEPKEVESKEIEKNDDVKEKIDDAEDDKANLKNEQEQTAAEIEETEEEAEQHATEAELNEQTEEVDSKKTGEDGVQAQVEEAVAAGENESAEVMQEGLNVDAAAAVEETVIANTNEAVIGQEIIVISDTGGNLVCKRKAELESVQQVQREEYVEEIKDPKTGEELLCLPKETTEEADESLSMLPGTGLNEQASGQPEVELTDQAEVVLVNDDSETKQDVSSQEEGLPEIGLENDLGTEEKNEYPLSEQASGEAELSINSGDATASADVYNNINKNIVGQNFSELIYNIFNNYEDNINLAEAFQAIIDQMNADLADVQGIVQNQNQALVNNLLQAIANTGENNLVTDGSSGEGAITTGNAAAEINAVNIINTNIVGNNWLFAVINVFGDWSGDLIIPGDLVMDLPYSSEYAQLDVQNQNQADIANELNAQSNTGENTLEGSGVINTGSAYSNVSLLNLVNTNIIQNNRMALSIDNFGFWFGNIIDWHGATSENGNHLDFSSEFVSGGLQKMVSSLRIFNNNNAVVQNSALADANTGNNSVNGDAEEGTITTGNANSFVNMFNMVNTNIIGNNWMFAKLNIFGNWKGNLIFAYPDVSVEVSADRSEYEVGQTINHQVTIKNEGRIEAKDVKIVFSVQGETGNPAQAQYDWMIGELVPGESRTFTAQTLAINDVENGSSNAIVANAQADTSTNEKVLNNNHADSKVSVKSKNLAVLDEDGADNALLAQPLVTKQAKLNYENTDSEMMVSRIITNKKNFFSGELIEHEILIENTGEEVIYEIELKDKLLFQDETMQARYIWPIGGLKKGEAVKVIYQVLINDTAQLGNYACSAYAKGIDRWGDEVRSNKSQTEFLIAGNYYGNSIFQDMEVPGDSQGFELISSAQAAEPQLPVVLGASNTCQPLPLWVWFAVLVSYGVALNWALFSKTLYQKENPIKYLFLPVIFSGGGYLFWLKYACDHPFWFLVGMGIILALHLIGKLYQKRYFYSDFQKPAASA